MINEFKDEMIFRRAYVLIKEFFRSQENIVELVRYLDLHNELFMIAADDYRFIRAIESETGHIPVGEVRKNFSLNAIKNYDEEIKQIAEFYKENLIKICEKIKLYIEEYLNNN